MNNLARTLKSQNRDGEALELMASCRELFIKVLGPSHSQTRNLCTTFEKWLSEARAARLEEEEQITNRMPGAFID